MDRRHGLDGKRRGHRSGPAQTKAEPLSEDRFAITGTKIFISSGDHDFGGNVVHLVLARLPDAPAG
jgi:alkylation response protein AidB-like acyl-CoA dehydrogenase